MLRLLVILAAAFACSDECSYRPASRADYSANDCSPRLEAPFRIGVNPGYYPKHRDFAQGTYWTDRELGSLTRDTGFETFRPALFASILSYYGDDVKRVEFDHYADIGLKDVVLFISGGWEVAGDAGGDRSTENFGCAENSKAFKGLYEPIFVEGRVNPANRFARFVAAIVDHYGDRVKVIEVWNEPDLPTNDLLGHRYDYAGQAQADSWWTRDPAPCELLNLYAPVTHYVRLMRVAYEVVRQYNAAHDRQLLVATGGIGYASFLRHLLEKTDNPDAGRVTAQYPLKGGAYFDLLSYHSYPFFMNYELERAKGTNVAIHRDGAKVLARHSDHLKDHPVFILEDLRRELAVAGYDDETYPRKGEIVTEVGMHDASWRLGTTDYGSSVPLQVSTVVKALVALARAGVRQVHLYKLGSSVAPGTPLIPDRWGDLEGGLWSSFGMYDDLTERRPGEAAPTPLGRAIALWNAELAGYRYDADATRALALPETLDGAAFARRWNDPRKLVLWAKSTRDLSEAARADYSLPKGILTGSLPRAQPFYGNAPRLVGGRTLELTGASPVLVR